MTIPKERNKKKAVSKSREKVYQAVKKIPKGKVSSYKIIATHCGIKSARLIGKILHQNTNPENIPCHRVIKSSGELALGYAFGGRKGQKIKLLREGVKFSGDSRVARSCML